MAVSSSILEKSLGTLPPDVILNIAVFLPARDKLALRLTCRSFYSTLSTPTAWRHTHWIYYNRKEKNTLKSILKLAQTVVEEVILTGPIVESPLTELYRCRQLRKVSGFKFTPAQLSKLISSLPNLTHLSIDVNNIKMFIPLLPVLGRLKQLVINHSHEFINAWANNGYKPPSLITISRHIQEVEQRLFPIPPHPATFSAYVIKRRPLDLVILKPKKYLEFEAGKQFTSIKYAESKDLESSKSLASSQDPTLIHEDHSIVALPFGTPLTYSGVDCTKFSFAEVAHTITSIDIYFFPPGALSYVANHCPKLQELSIRIADNDGHLPADFLNGLSDVARECKELRGLNVLALHASKLNISTVSFWEAISRMSHLTHLGVPYCFLLPPIPDNLDDDQYWDIEEPASKRKCVDTKVIEDAKRAIKSLRNVKAIQLQGVTVFPRDCRLCYYHSGLQFSSMVCETLSIFESLKYVCYEEVQKVDLACLLSSCKGVQVLTFHRAPVSLPEETSGLVNVRQVHLCVGYDTVLTKFIDTLASATNLTHLSIESPPEGLYSAEGVCTLIQKIPSLVFLQIVYYVTWPRSSMREIRRKVNIFTKSIKRSYLEFRCQHDILLDDSDIDGIWYSFYS